MRTDYLTEAEVDGLRRIVASIERLDDETGGWSSKFDARKTGFSMHVRWQQPVDVMATMEFVNLMEQAPGLLLTAAKKLLAANTQAAA